MIVLFSVSCTQSKFRKRSWTKDQIQLCHSSFHESFVYGGGGFHWKVLCELMFPDLLNVVRDERKVADFMEGACFYIGHSRFQPFLDVMHHLILSFEHVRIHHRECHGRVFHYIWTELQNLCEHLRYTPPIPGEQHGGRFWVVDPATGWWECILELHHWN